MNRPKKMEVFLTIRRQKTTIFTDATENTTVGELKKIIEGIMKIKPCDQMLFNKDIIKMDDERTLKEYGITKYNAKPQNPALVGLVARMESGDFEPLQLKPYSSPPNLMEIFKFLDTHH